MALETSFALSFIPILVTHVREERTKPMDIITSLLMFALRDRPLLWRISWGELLAQKKKCSSTGENGGPKGIETFSPSNVIHDVAFTSWYDVIILYLRFSGQKLSPRHTACDGCNMPPFSGHIGFYGSYTTSLHIPCTLHELCRHTWVARNKTKIPSLSIACKSEFVKLALRRIALWC